MLNNLDVDLLFTGELSHHEALAAIEKGKCVITAFHSNTERAFFRKKMQPTLVKEVGQVIASLVDKGEWAGKDVGEGFNIAVSEADADPFKIVMKGEVFW
jgi:putative NIF3 family GTP cyclohydrolase 1 type 2